MRSFVMSLLRSGTMKWGPKHSSLNRAIFGPGKNPVTGRPCKLHKCEIEGTLHAKGDMHADHIDPVVPVDGQWGNAVSWLGYNWNELIPRLFVEEEGFQVISHALHKEKSKQENAARRGYKKA